MDEVHRIECLINSRLLPVREGMAQKLTSFNFCDKLEGITRTRDIFFYGSADLFRDEVNLYNEEQAIKEGRFILKQPMFSLKA